MKKLICVDVDGTLVNNGFEVSQANRKKMGEMDAKFLIVSGRTVNELLMLDLPYDLIGSNGGEIYKNRRRTEKLSLSKDVSAKIIDYFKEMGYYIIVHTDKGQYIQKDSLEQVTEELEKIIARLTSSTEESEHMRSHMLNHVYGKSTKVDDLYAFVLENDITINKLESHFDLDKTEIFKTLTGDYEVEAFNSAGRNIEIVPKGAMKDLAIQKYIGDERYQIIAIGDGDNDLPMLKMSDYAIAMGNATDKLKAIADAVVADAGDGGFVEALKLVEGLD